MFNEFLQYLPYVVTLRLVNVLVFHVLKQNMKTKIDNKLQFILFLCIIAIYEELLWRDYIPNKIDFYWPNFGTNKNILLSVLFGLSHISNYTYIKNVYLIFIQVSSCVYLGYILYLCKTLTVAILLHACYNLSVIIHMYINNYEEEHTKVYCKKPHRSYSYESLFNDKIGYTYDDVKNPMIIELYKKEMYRKPKTN